MNLNDLTIFRLMSDKMAWDNQRQEVLSQNIANADTPGYKSSDLAAFDFKQELRHATQLPLMIDQAGQMPGVGPTRATFRSGADRTPYETKPDGNAVTLEDQLSRMSQNNIDFQALTNLLQKQITMLKSALRGSGA